MLADQGKTKISGPEIGNRIFVVDKRQMINSIGQIVAGPVCPSSMTNHSKQIVSFSLYGSLPILDHDLDVAVAIQRFDPVQFLKRSVLAVRFDKHDFEIAKILQSLDRRRDIATRYALG